MSSKEYPKTPLCAAGAIVIRDGRLLMIQRAGEPGTGLWAVPGGMVELGESLKEAVEREVHEETGLVVRAKEPVFTFDMIRRDEKGVVKYHYIIVDIQAEYISGTPFPGDDASDVAWVSPMEMDGLPMSEHTRSLLKKIIKKLNAGADDV